MVGSILITRHYEVVLFGFESVLFSVPCASGLLMSLMRGPSTIVYSQKSGNMWSQGVCPTRLFPLTLFTHC